MRVWAMFKCHLLLVALSPRHCASARDAAAVSPSSRTRPRSGEIGAAMRSQRDADGVAAEPALPSRVLLHFGTVARDGDLAADAPVLHVDAREDRLLEIRAGRVTRTVAFSDVVRYVADEDDDLGEFRDYAEYLDDDDERACHLLTLVVRRSGARATSPNVHPEGSDSSSPSNDDDDTVELHYRLQSSAELRAMRAVLERLSAGRLDPNEAPRSSLPGLDPRVLRSGTLTCRLGRFPSGATSRAAGRWISCSAAVVPGKLILLADASAMSSVDDEQRRDAPEPDAPSDAPFAPSAPSDGPFVRAPVLTTGGRARNLVILAAHSLADARVVVRAPRWNDGGCEFDVVAPPGRRASLACVGGGWRTRDAWIRALEDAAGAVGTRVGTQGADSSGCERGKENDWSEGRGPSTALDADTRAALAETARVAVALAENLAEGRHTVSDDPERTRPSPGTKTRTRTGTGTGTGTERSASVPSPSPGTIPGTERALVLHRYWKRVELGVSANFLFNFSTRETTRRGARTLVHVDTSRRAVECYVPRKNTRGYPAMVLRRSFEVRDVATPREPRESNPRASLLVSAGAGSSARGAIFARFVFDTVADRSVFETLVGDLRAGRYRDADDYHLRGVLKRGWEGGEGWTPPRPERYLALVPGKLLALPSHVAAIPSDAVSLAEGAEVIVRAGKSRAPRGDEDEDGALALVEVTAGGTRRSFRMPNVAAASAWARAIRDAVPRDGARVKRVPEGEGKGENATTEADAAAPAPSGNDASSPASIGESIPPVVASSPSPPASPRGFEFVPSPRRRWSFPANSHEDEFSAKVEPANNVDARLAAMEARVALAEAAAAEASSRAAAERDARLRVEAETRARAEADAAAEAEAEARRERAKLAAEAEAREAFARAEARAEARLAEEFEARAAALAAELDADARERAGVEEATRARAAARAKLRAAEDARVVAAAEDEARRLESFRIAEEAKRRVESESAAKADARAKMEARVEAEERAAAAERAAANASSRAAAEKAEAIRKVKEENEHRVRVRERLRAEEEARVSAEEEAREVIRARAEADETRRMASLAARLRAEEDEQARRRRAEAEAAAAEAEAKAKAREREADLAAEVAAAVARGFDPFEGAPWGESSSPRATASPAGAPFFAAAATSPDPHPHNPFEPATRRRNRTPPADVARATSPTSPGSPPRVRSPLGDPTKSNSARRASFEGSVGDSSDDEDHRREIKRRGGARLDGARLDVGSGERIVVGVRRSGSGSGFSTRSSPATARRVPPPPSSSSSSSPEAAVPVSASAPSPPPPTPDLGHLIAARVARGGGGPNETAAAARSPPPAAPGTPDWSHLVGASFAAKDATTPMSRERGDLSADFDVAAGSGDGDGDGDETTAHPRLWFARVRFPTVDGMMTEPRRPRGAPRRIS